MDSTKEITFITPVCGKETDILKNIENPKDKEAVFKALDSMKARHKKFLGFFDKEAVGASGLPGEQLADLLVKVAACYALTPVSHFNVGAAALTSDGRIFLGANGEYTGAPLGVSIHAEQAAVSQFINNTFGRRVPPEVEKSGIVSISVTAEPCGHCRQFLVEQEYFQEPHKIMIRTSGKEPVPLPTLLPRAFTPAALAPHCKLPSGKMAPPPEAGAGEWAALACSTLDKALFNSRAPYSGVFVGGGIEFGFGGRDVHTGCYIENAAYNPSFLPLSGAVVAAIFAGKDIKEAKLCAIMSICDSPTPSVSNEGISRLQLSLFAPKAKFRSFVAQKM